MKHPFNPFTTRPVSPWPLMKHDVVANNGVMYRQEGGMTPPPMEPQVQPKPAGPPALPQPPTGAPQGPQMAPNAPSMAPPPPPLSFGEKVQQAKMMIKQNREGGVILAHPHEPEAMAIDAVEVDGQGDGPVMFGEGAGYTVNGEVGPDVGPDDVDAMIPEGSYVMNAEGTEMFGPEMDQMEATAGPPMYNTGSQSMVRAKLTRGERVLAPHVVDMHRSRLESMNRGGLMVRDASYLNSGGEADKLARNRRWMEELDLNPREMDLLADRLGLKRDGTSYKAEGGGVGEIAKNKRGTFKAQASRMGESVQEAADTILSAPEGHYSPEMRKKANFARNFARNEGGLIYRQEGGAPDINIPESKKGSFKAQATRMGESVQEAAKTILDAPEGRYSPAMRKKANFARNFAKNEGGLIYRQEGGLGEFLTRPGVSTIGQSLGRLSLGDLEGALDTFETARAKKEAEKKEAPQGTFSEEYVAYPPNSDDYELVYRKKDGTGYVTGDGNPMPTDWSVKGTLGNLESKGLLDYKTDQAGVAAANRSVGTNAAAINAKMVDKVSEARTTITQAERAIDLITTPDGRAFVDFWHKNSKKGFFADIDNFVKGLATSAVTILEEGIGVGEWNIGLDLTRTIEKAALSESQKRVGDQIKQALAELHVIARKAIQGQGQITDSEAQKVYDTVGDVGFLGSGSNALVAMLLWVQKAGELSIDMVGSWSNYVRESGGVGKVNPVNFALAWDAEAADFWAQNDIFVTQKEAEALLGRETPKTPEGDFTVEEEEEEQGSSPPSNPLVVPPKVVDITGPTPRPSENKRKVVSWRDKAKDFLGG